MFIQISMFEQFKSHVEKTPEKRTVTVRCRLNIGQIKEILQYAHVNNNQSDIEIAKFFTTKWGREIPWIVISINRAKKDIFAKMPIVYNNLTYYNNYIQYEVPVEILEADEANQTLAKI